MKAKNTVGSLRDVVQDLLVPEVKAIKVDVEALRNEVRTSVEALRNELRVSDEALRSEMRLRDENQTSISEKLDYAIDIRARLAVLEDRTPRVWRLPSAKIVE